MTIRRELEGILSGQRQQLKRDREIIDEAATGELQAVFRRRARGDDRFITLVNCLRSVIAVVDNMIEEQAVQKQADKKLQALQTAYAKLAEQKEKPDERFAKSQEELTKAQVALRLRNRKLHGLGIKVEQLEEQNETLRRKIAILQHRLGTQRV
jgi:chromosome segregation ATPase